MPVSSLHVAIARRDVAVADEADARAGLAHLGDERLVAIALEDDRGQILDLAPLASASALQVPRRRLA